MLFAASGIENIVVVIGDDKPSDDSTKDDIEDGDFKDFGNHKGDVEEGETIKIKPSKPVTGEVVVIYSQEGELAIGDVKVYVKPKKDDVTPVIVAPGEPEGPGGNPE